jgi:hypothetical protein
MAILTSPLRPGVTVTDDQCYAAECGAPGLSSDQQLVCADNNYTAAKAGCIDPTCAPYRSQIPWCSGGGGSTAVPPSPAPTPAPQLPAAQTAPAAPPPPAAPAASKTVPVTVQTDTGQQTTILVPASQTPGTTDQALTPAMVHIPNIWDSLDPTKASQFEYRGLSRTLPPWISPAYRRSLMQAAAPAPAAGDTGASGIPWWVWLAIGGTAYALRGKR